MLHAAAHEICILLAVAAGHEYRCTCNMTVITVGQYFSASESFVLGISTIRSTMKKCLTIATWQMCNAIKLTLFFYMFHILGNYCLEGV